MIQRLATRSPIDTTTEQTSDGPRRNNHYQKVMKGSPAGGSYSTAPDLLRFSRALVAGKLLDPQHVDLCVSGKVDRLGGRYAYGFVDNGDGSFGHTGGANGVSTAFRLFPEEGLTLVVLGNFDTGTSEIEGFATRLIRRMAALQRAAPGRLDLGRRGG